MILSCLNCEFWFLDLQPADDATEAQASKSARA